MPGIRLRVDATVDDPLVPDLPLTRRIEVDEANGFKLTLASSASYQQLAPLSQFTTLNGYILAFDQAVTVRFAAQTDTGQALNAGGFLVGLDTNISNASNNGVLVLYNGGGTLVVRGQAYGA
jgi:hypothetical protein